MDVDIQHEQPPLAPLMLDISGDPELPVPVAIAGDRCACCGIWTEKLWQGARAGFTDSHTVCTLCYLAGHLDSPTAAHGLLAFLPGMAMSDVHHLQRRALIAIRAGNKIQRREGQKYGCGLPAMAVKLSRHGARRERESTPWPFNVCPPISA